MDPSAARYAKVSVEMRIGIVGAGALGSTLAELWTTAGHQVAVGEPEPEAASALAETLGPSVQASSVEEAARYGEVVVLTGAFGRAEMLPPASAVAGKIVIDATNALTETGEAIDLGARASSAIVAETFPDGRVVKAFNTLEADTLRAESRLSTPREKRFVVFLAGDDSRAKERVSTLIEEIGFAPIDAGSLALGGRYLEPRSKLFGRPLLPAEARRLLQMMS
jgi:8-hydroxy-5-deazaflavin:NADPH oxidoreductase